MIALRVAAAALMLGAAPLTSSGQQPGPDVGTVPSDWEDYAQALVASSRQREAIAAFQRAMQARPSRAAASAWAVARLYAQLGNRKQAVRWVERAIDLGFNDREAIRRSPEFATYGEDPRLSQLLRPVSVSKARVALLTSYF